MRLIDADALGLRFVPKQAYLTAHILEKIDTAPTVDGWISVEDKKRPLLGSLVIVCLQDEKTQRVRMSYYDKYKGVEIWSDMPVGFEVTHWMPLPEPPNEETDGNSSV